MSITLKKLEPVDCGPNLLANFNRYQKVERCWRKENGSWVLKDISFVNQWDAEEKAKKAAALSSCILQGGIAIGAFDGNSLIGFSSVEGVLFGSNREYLNLAMLHVSYEFRNQGIGRKLFSQVCDAAKQMGAEKLYISANSSEESQGFYRSLGCRDAAEINQALFEAEPFDCHMEYCL